MRAGREFARGLVNYDAGELRRIRGAKTRDIEAARLQGLRRGDPPRQPGGAVAGPGRRRAPMDDRGSWSEARGAAPPTDAARAGSRWRRRAPRTTRSPRWRAGSRRRSAPILEANRADLDARPRARASRGPSSTGSPSPTTASRRWRRACGTSPPCPTRSARRCETWRRPERPRDRAGARAARRDRLHLRVAPQRHRRRRRALPQGRQRGRCCAAAARRSSRTR